MIEKFEKPAYKLEDVGTRYQHLTELQDIWAQGVEALKQSYNRYPNPKDQLQLAQVEAALKLLKIHQEQLANWERKKWALEEEIEKLPRPKPIPRLTEGSAPKDK